MTPEQYLTETLAGFRHDPPDNDFQEGYLSALATMASELYGIDADDILVKKERPRQVPVLTVIKGDKD